MKTPEVKQNLNACESVFRKNKEVGSQGAGLKTLALEPGQWEARVARGTEAELRQGPVGGGLRALRAGAGAQ